MLSKSANAIIGLCFKNGIPCSITGHFNATYTIDDVRLKFTEELLDEVLNSGNVKQLYRGEKYVNLTGISGGLNNDCNGD